MSDRAKFEAILAVTAALRGSADAVPAEGLSYLESEVLVSIQSACANAECLLRRLQGRAS